MMTFEVIVEVWRWRIALASVSVASPRLAALAELAAALLADELAERDLQRARVRQQQPSTHVDARAAGGHEERSAPSSVRESEAALSVEDLTSYFATKPHIRDAARVAAACVKRGLSRVEREDAERWLEARRKTQPRPPEREEHISDEEHAWRRERAGEWNTEDDGGTERITDDAAVKPS